MAAISIKISLILIFFVISNSAPTYTQSQPLITMLNPQINGQDYPLGSWKLLKQSVGISAMHMQLLYNGKIIMFDRTDFGPSNISLPTSTNCHTMSNGATDCTAHSVLFDVDSNEIRPLTILTDTWCSSGSLNSDGTLVQTGGYDSGERVIRVFTPCNDDGGCDWVELNQVTLAARRWYASNQILPDGRVIVVGGRGTHTYEFLPKRNNSELYYLPFLAETWDGIYRENNLYPFLHLLPNGNIFIFANNRSIEFDFISGKIVREFPVILGVERRNYPSTGSSVLLPMLLDSGGGADVEVLICGGTQPNAFDLADEEKVYVEASNTCGRMKLNVDQPQWIMETMPMPRVMPDMITLPTGDVLIINGASNGAAGWDNADNPCLNPVLYKTYEPDRSNRFVVLNPTSIPRMYHSSSVLVPDGRVIVGGSNPNPTYNFTTLVRYPTEISVEAFSPPYLDETYSIYRPSISAAEVEGNVVVYGQMVGVRFTLGVYRGDLGLAVTMVQPAFGTHSLGMNQRVLVLGSESVGQLSRFGYKVVVRAPGNANVAPPGYYMLFVVHAGVPSHGVWIKLKHP